MRYSEATDYGFAAAELRSPLDARFTLTRPDPVGLPVLTGESLHAALQQLSFPDLLSCLRSRLLPLPGDAGYAICGERGRTAAAAGKVQVSARIGSQAFIEAVRVIWGDALRERATFTLDKSKSEMSARKRFTMGQMAVLFVTCLLVACGSWSLPFVALLKTAAFLAAVLFLAVVAVRVLVLLPYKHQGQKGNAPILADDELPTYSVLVPLFREIAVLDSLLGSLGNIDYPAKRLDIKIIVEEGDKPMRRALSEFRLPAHFEIVVVPAGKPQTKPRALNYALQFAFGDLVTIYDAEDLPSPTQLRRCVEAFAAAPPHLACLQARLKIHNADQTWLTRQFALEYAVLFGEVLPALADCGLPLPLGGTSNHFRAKLLRKVGGWDPFNVTEDADLGFRLARMGYSTGTIDSDTLEEACDRHKDWRRQRARWLKGFLQTWLVHMREPRRSWRELGSAGFWVLQAVTIGVFMSALLHPLLLALALWSIWQKDASVATLLSSSTWVYGFSLMIFVTGYGASMWIALRTLRRNAITGWWWTLVTLPFYWLLLTPAAWQALSQFVTDLHGWNKTPHGQSRQLG